MLADTVVVIGNVIVYVIIFWPVPFLKCWDNEQHTRCDWITLKKNNPVITYAPGDHLDYYFCNQYYQGNPQVAESNHIINHP